MFQQILHAKPVTLFQTAPGWDVCPGDGDRATLAVGDANRHEVIDPGQSWHRKQFTMLWVGPGAGKHTRFPAERRGGRRIDGQCLGDEGPAPVPGMRGIEIGVAGADLPLAIQKKRTKPIVLVLLLR